MTKHPATYTGNFIPRFATLLYGRKNVLDPFAGTGKLALIKQHGFTGRVVCNEIEPEWAESSLYDVDEWHIGDAEHMSVIGYIVLIVLLGIGAWALIRMNRDAR